MPITDVPITEVRLYYSIIIDCQDCLGLKTGSFLTNSAHSKRIFCVPNDGCSAPVLRVESLEEKKKKRTEVLKFTPYRPRQQKFFGGGDGG